MMFNVNFIPLHIDIFLLLLFLLPQLTTNVMLPRFTDFWQKCSVL